MARKKQIKVHKKNIHQKKKTQSHNNTKKSIEINNKKDIQKTSFEEYQSKNFFEKYVGNWGLFIALCLILIIGFLSYWDYLILKYSYYFSDIGSDTLNSKFPLVNRTRNPQHGPYGMRRGWSFYYGMGQNTFRSAIINPIEYIFRQIGSFVADIYGKGYRYSGKFPTQFFTHIIGSGLLFYLYLRFISKSKYVSIIGAILWAFLGYMTLGGTWGHTRYPFFGIFLLFSFEQLYKKDRWIFFPFAILLMVYNAYILFTYTGVFLLLYSVFRYYSDYGVKIKGYLILFGKMVFLGLIGALMYSVNLVSQYMRMFGAPRVSGNVSTISSMGKSAVFESARYAVYEVSERITMFYRLFSNDLLGNGSNYKGWYNYLEAPVFYCGLIILLLIPQLFILLRKKRVKIAYAGFLGFWFLVAMFPFLRHAVQAFVGNYYKLSIDIFVPFVLIFSGLSSLHLIIKNNKLNIPLLLGTVSVLIIGLYLPLIPEKYNILDKGLRYNIILFLISYTILLILLVKLPKYKLIFQIILLFVISAELVHSTSVTMNRRAAYSIEEIKDNAGGYDDGSIDAVNYLRSIDKGFFRLEKDYASGTAQHRSLNDAQMQGYYGTSSYRSFNNKHYIEFLEGIGVIQLGKETSTRWAPGLLSRPLLQSLASVKYYLTKNNESFWQKNHLARPIQKIKGIHILKSNFYLPFGYTYDSYILRSDYNKLNQFQKDIAMLRACVIDEDETDFKDVTSGLQRYTLKDTVPSFNLNILNYIINKRREDTLDIEKQSMTYFEGEIDVETSKVLFFSTPYDIGWRAKVDGESVHVTKVNIGLLGVKLKPGKHHVILEYIPPYYKASLWLTRIAYIILIVLLLVKNRKSIVKMPEILQDKFKSIRNLQIMKNKA